MSETSPIFVIILIVVALAFTKLVTAIFKIELKPVKYETIDGLRGYLAFFVFVHHSSVYFFFLKEWKWDLPPSNLYSHLGQTSVSIFFMITGFLFFSKLIDAKTKKIDWIQYFVSRFFRLYPLYLVVLVLMIIAVFIMSNYQILEPISLILSEIKSWLFFAVIDSPNINKYAETNGVMASVIWSIKYEWLFYFSLPLIGFLFFKQNPSKYIIILSVIIFVYIYMNSNNLIIHFITFISGLVAAIVIRQNSFVRISKHFVSSIVIICCLTCSVYFFNTAYNYPSLMLTSIAFILIACGNNLFGILTLKTSRYLSQLSFSIYLIHTTILFFIFRIFIGFEISHTFSLEFFWLIITFASILILGISFITYYFIELPFINYTPYLTKKIRIIKTKYLR